MTTWFAGINGLAVATAASFTLILLLSLRHGTENFIKRASSTALALLYLPFLGGFIILIARPDNGLAGLNWIDYCNIYWWGGGFSLHPRE
jgi:phosphatidate cytidylyltransferase